MLLFIGFVRTFLNSFHKNKRNTNNKLRKDKDLESTHVLWRFEGKSWMAFRSGVFIFFPHFNGLVRLTGDQSSSSDVKRKGVNSSLALQRTFRKVPPNSHNFRPNFKREKQNGNEREREKKRIEREAKRMRGKREDIEGVNGGEKEVKWRVKRGFLLPG